MKSVFWNVPVRKNISSLKNAASRTRGTAGVHWFLTYDKHPSLCFAVWSQLSLLPEERKCYVCLPDRAATVYSFPRNASSVLPLFSNHSGRSLGTSKVILKQFVFCISLCCLPELLRYPRASNWHCHRSMSSFWQPTSTTVLTYPHVHHSHLRLCGCIADVLIWSRLFWPLLLFCKNPALHCDLDMLWSTVLAQGTALQAKQVLLPWNEPNMGGWDFHFPPRRLDAIRVRRKKTF